VGESQISQDDGIVKPSETSETWSQRLLGSSSSWVINKITDVKWQPCAQESQECNSMVSFHEVHMDGLMQANTGNFRKFRQWCHTQIWRHPNHSEVVTIAVSHYQILMYIYIYISLYIYIDIHPHFQTMKSPWIHHVQRLNIGKKSPFRRPQGRFQRIWQVRDLLAPGSTVTTAGIHGIPWSGRGGPKRQNHRQIGGTGILVV